ncbi:unnamed protein product, partial [Rotaria socialis]
MSNYGKDSGGGGGGRSSYDNS